MEEKRHDPAAQPPSSVDSPASEPPSSRRRGGGQKRKANSLNATNSSSTPSKRIAREKPAHPLPIHNSPLTRTRQIPNSHAVAAASASAAGGGSTFSATAVKHSEHAAPPAEALGGGSVPVAEGFHEESQWEALKAAIEAEFETIRSRGANAHVVPSPCGWFSWMDLHSIEKHTLPSFFNGKTENRTPDVYMEIRNWIMKKFHGNPNAQIELKDLLELNVGDLDARQEVMEFLDYWGLINFHPFPSMDSAVATADDDGKADKTSLVEKLYRLETLQLCPPVVPKASLMTPAMPSGLFPDSTIADELVKQEGPAVEYHCNSCSVDCSRKRYHCQKQADFDLCTNCFSNGKFGSGMSSLDFILMEPAEVLGISGGKWTDQETLLLLEALELFKENWNEIAEHVATKSKTQCILHFVQMPIEDAFIDSSDDIDANCKETADRSTNNGDSSVHKDASEIMESKISNSFEGQVLIPPHKETSKAEDANKVETPKPEDGDEGASKTEDAAEVIYGHEAGDACALKALKEAFEAAGYSAGPKGPSSFTEVGNPVMALAAFLVHMVGSDVAVASAHSSFKSISGNSPTIELAVRHCFLLEDPPDDNKEPTYSERDSKKDGEQDDINGKQDNSMLDDKDSSHDCNDKKIENNALEDKKQLVSTDGGAAEKPIFAKEQALLNHEEVRLDNCHYAGNSKLSTEQAPSTVQDLDGSTSQAEIPPSFEELGEGNLVKEPYKPAEELKDRHVVSDSLPSEDHELQQSVISNSAREHPQPDVEMVSDSVHSEKSSTQKPLKTNPVGESLETTVSVMDVDLVSNSLPSEKNESQPLVTLNSAPQNGASTGEDETENGTKVKDDNRKTKYDDKYEKVNQAAVSTLTAAAVKAKLLANHEEDQIQQLATSLIEKQLQKLEKKLAFIDDVEKMVIRVREYLNRSRQKLYHERALLIASRLGLPASSSRGVPPSVPTNRIPINFANSVRRPPISMNPQRPPVSRPMGTAAAAALVNPLASATAARNSIQPSSQNKVSSVETK